MSATSGDVLHASALPLVLERAGVLSDGGVVLLPYLPSAFDFGGGVVLVADATRPWALVWIAPDGTVQRASRIPGATPSLRVDAEGSVWVSSSVSEPSPFTFGGAEFALHGRYVAAYEGGTGAHIRSFRLLVDTPLDHVFASTDAVFALEAASGSPEVRRYDVAGDTATSTTAARRIDLRGFVWGGQVSRMGTSMEAAVVSSRQIALVDVDDARIVGDFGGFDLAVDVSPPIAVAHERGVYLAGALGRAPTRFGEDLVSEGYEGFFLTEVVFAP
ncbi:MAG: hypothetical protein J0L92_34180 [Deltaproteobacteria bacterium]|nr:hypothetical protein [Deltaproteobacteria bacterium]